MPVCFVVAVVLFCFIQTVLQRINFLYLEHNIHISIKHIWRLKLVRVSNYIVLITAEELW